MTKIVITDEIKKVIQDFLENNPAELVNTYLHYVEHRFNLEPVVFPKDKVIYQGAEDAVKQLEKEGKLWHETEITIHFGQSSVNEETKKIYICPFSGKVFADNTCPNPQDAIYDWVSKCPENKERVGGLRVKRFFISEDPDVIKSYIDKTKLKKEAVKKVVYTSVLSGKLFNSKKAVIDDFKRNYLKKLTLEEVQSQNKFQIEDSFLDFIQKQLNEEKITAFVESLADHKEFLPYVERWIESSE
jgi:hypothetical protein